MPKHTCITPLTHHTYTTTHTYTRTGTEHTAETAKRGREQHTQAQPQAAPSSPRRLHFPAPSESPEAAHPRRNRRRTGRLSRPHHPSLLCFSSPFFFSKFDFLRPRSRRPTAGGEGDDVLPRMKCRAIPAPLAALERSPCSVARARYFFSCRFAWWLLFFFGDSCLPFELQVWGVVASAPLAARSISSVSFWPWCSHFFPIPQQPCPSYTCNILVEVC